MCPVCLANVGLVASGVASTSGLAALAAKRVLFKWQEKSSTKRDLRRTNESRDIGAKNTEERGQS